MRKKWKKNIDGNQGKNETSFLHHGIPKNKKQKPGATHNWRPGNRPLTVCFWTAFMLKRCGLLYCGDVPVCCLWFFYLSLQLATQRENVKYYGQSLAHISMACKKAITGTFCSHLLVWNAWLECQRYLAAAAFFSTFAVWATTMLVYEWWEQSHSSFRTYPKKPNGSRLPNLLSRKWGISKQHQKLTLSTTRTRTIISTLARITGRNKNNIQKVWSNRHSKLSLHPCQFASKSYAIF